MMALAERTKVLIPPRNLLSKGDFDRMIVSNPTSVLASSFLLRVIAFIHPCLHSQPKGVDCMRIGVFGETVRDCGLLSGDPVAGDIVPIQVRATIKPEEFWTMSPRLPMYWSTTSPPGTDL